MKLSGAFHSTFVANKLLRAGAPTLPAVKMITRFAHSGNVPAETGFNAASITTTLSPSSVAQQASFPGDVMITIGAHQQTSFPDLGQYLTNAASYPNIKWVYLYDELGWTGSGYDFTTWQQLVTPAQQIQAAGLKVAVTIIPEVVLQPGFTLDFTYFDVIGLDSYPSSGIDWTLGSFQHRNKILNQLINAKNKLDTMGFTKDVWYVYQGFGLQNDPDLILNLVLQKEAIATVASLGFTGLVCYGMYDETGTNLPPPFFAGIDSNIPGLFRGI